MSNLEILNNVTHHDLCVNTVQSEAFGANVAGAVLYPFEIMAAHKEYPIFFQKEDATSSFQAVALFGFADEENLFLDSDGWSANYIPAVFRREPFVIGLQRNEDGSPGGMLMKIDMDSPRVNREGSGKALFLESGGNSQYLEDTRELLQRIHEGVSASKEMFKQFQSLDLIESCAVDVSFSDGKKFKSDVFYTIDKEKLFALDDRVIGELHRSGLLQIAYMIIDSLSNINTLIGKRNLSSVKS